MPTEWEPAVQKSAQLTVCLGDELKKAPAWGETLALRIIEEFNRMAAQYLLGVRFVLTGDPPQKNGTGANVLFEVTNGPCPYFSLGKEKMGHLDVTPGHVRGKTFGAIVERNIGPKMYQTFIYVPAKPLVTRRSPANTELKFAVTLHELLHTCGLSGEDPGHGVEGQLQILPDLDVFATDSQFDGDHVVINTRRVCDNALHFHLSPRTINLVQSIWLLGRL